MAPDTPDSFLVNLVPVGAGGGLQNGLSFVVGLAGLDQAHPFVVACRRGSAIEQKCIELNIPHEAIGGGFFSRVACELWLLAALGKRHRAKVIFTLFGNPPFNSGGMVKISGFAYSNIIQTEVPFWNFLPFHKRVIKLLKDRLRLFMARQSDELILETPYLYARGKEGVFKDKKLHVVEMEPSILVRARDRASALVRDEGGFDFLYLSGPHPNKRIHLLAPIIAELNRQERPSRLIVTLPESAAYTQAIRAAFIEHDVEHQLKNIGPVEPKNVADLLHSVDGVVNIALLESFSNNWVEAWASRKALICTDAEWARASCGDGAIYIDPDRPKEAAEQIREGLNDLTGLLERGDARLKQLGGERTKIQKYMDIIARHLG